MESEFEKRLYTRDLYILLGTKFDVKWLDW